MGNERRQVGEGHGNGAHTHVLRRQLKARVDSCCKRAGNPLQCFDTAVAPKRLCNRSRFVRAEFVDAKAEIL